MMDASSAALIEGLREAAKAKAKDLSGQFDPSPRRLVGSGGYSTVYVAAWRPLQRENPVNVCYKELRPPVSNLHETVYMIKKTVKYLTREMEIWSELDHPHILKFLGFAIEGVGCDVKGVLISPWCSNGSILEYLQKNPDSEKINLVSGIAKGLDYLHHRMPAIIHGDLKPANVLVSDDHNAILCDFGLSRFSSELSTGQTSSATNFTIRFAPLEILDEKRKSTESDVYSFACTCIPILFGKQPYSDLSDMQILGRHPQLQKKAPWDWDFEDPLQRTLSHCCSVVPENRPSIRKVLQTVISAESKSYPFCGDTENVPKSIITGFSYPSPHDASMLNTSEPSNTLSAEEPNGGEDIVPRPTKLLRKLWLRRQGTNDNQGPVPPADQASGSSSSVPPTFFGGDDSSLHQSRKPLPDRDYDLSAMHISKRVLSKSSRGQPVPSASSAMSGLSFSGATSANIIWNGVLNALCIANDTLDSVPVPGLRGAIHGFLEVVKQLKTVGGINDAISELQNSIKLFNRSVLKALKRYQRQDAVSPELVQPIETLSSELIAITMPLQSYCKKSTVYLWVNRDKFQGAIRLAGQRVHNSVIAFQATHVARVRLGVAPIEDEMKKVQSREGALKEKAKQLESYLNTLPSTGDASHDTNRLGAPSICFPGTRSEILWTINQWFRRPISDTTKPVFWVNGLAGIGKSTIACTIAQDANESGHLGSSFFFSRQHAELSSAKFFLGTIVRNIAMKLPEFGAAVAEALKEDSNLPRASPLTQYSSLLFTPLRGLEVSKPLLLVIDALDQCKRDDANGAKEILRHLISGYAGIRGLRILITSRPESHIVTELMNVDKIVIHEIDKHVASRDIEVYLRGQLHVVSERFSDRVSKGWLTSAMVSALAKKADRLFIWAATVVKYIDSDDVLDPMHQLESILEDSQTTEADPYAELDKLYERVLSACVTKTPSEKRVDLYRLLHTIVLLKSPLPLKALGAFVMISNPTPMLTHTQSIIPLPPLPEGRVEVYHPSFPEFLLQRCKDPEFRVDVEKHERWMALRCLDLLVAELVPAVDEIVPWYSLNADVEDLSDKLSSLVGEEVQYACRFWASHLRNLRSVDEEVRDALEKFTGFGGDVVQGLLLRWMKVMSMMGLVGDAARSLRDILPWVRSTNILVHVAPVLHDAFRMISTYAPTIEASAAHITQSIFQLLPTNSQLTGTSQEAPDPTVTVRAGCDSEWPLDIATLTGHSDTVTAVVFSPDGSLLASSSDDSTIKLWDPHTRSRLRTLGGHSKSKWTRSTAFSGDGLLLASACDDYTIRLWDPDSGSNVRTLEDPSHMPIYVTFSSDGSRLASASSDHTVRLWDPRTGNHLNTLKGHTSWVRSVTFSPDGMIVASASDDHTARLWNVRNGKHIRTLAGHSYWVRSVAFSPDGLLLATGSEDCTIKLWDPHTGADLKTLEGHSDAVMCVSFSPDGSLLASASEDYTISLWDHHSGNHLRTLKGHSHCLKFVAFSPDGLVMASASDDHTVKMWDPHTGSHPKALGGHSCLVTSVAFSPNTSLLASASGDCTIKLWDPHTGNHLQTLEGHSHWVRSVAFSPNGLLLASASSDCTIRLWDIQTRTAKILEGHSHSVTSVAFSLDGLLASASSDCTIRLWDSRTGDHLRTLKGHSDWVASVAFSPDGSTLASESNDHTIRLWNPHTGSPLKILEDHSDSMKYGASSMHYVAFQQGVSKSALHIRDGQWLCVDTAYLFSLPLNLSTWVSQGSLAAFGFTNGCVLILDVSSALTQLGCT